VARDEAVIDAHWQARFNEAMNDDFNTPEALSVLFQLTHEINKNKDKQLVSTLIYLANLLGLLNSPADEFLKNGLEDIERDRIEALLAERLQARAEKNWARADEIREQLKNEGIELEDGSQGTQWRKISA